MTYDKPITVNRMDPETEEWSPAWRLHARINKTGGGQSFSAGADQYRATLTFEVRYFRELEELRRRPQLFRIVYRDQTFRLADYDDYMEMHQTVKLVGEAFG